MRLIYVYLLAVVIYAVICYVYYIVSLYRNKKANRKELLSISQRNTSKEIIKAAKMLSDQKYSYYKKYRKNFIIQLFSMVATMLGIIGYLEVFLLPRLKTLPEKTSTLQAESWELIVIGILTVIDIVISVSVSGQKYKNAWKTCEREMNSVVNGADKYNTWEQYLTRKYLETKDMYKKVNANYYSRIIKDNRDILKEFANITKQNAEKTVESIQELVNSDKTEKPLEKVKKHLTSIKTCIITVMPEEFAALKALLKNIEYLDEETQIRTDLCCCFGEVSGADAGEHLIGLFLFSENANTTIDNYSKKLMTIFVQLKHIIICGIAGGVPQIESIGDVVVSTAGLFQYDCSGKNGNAFVIRDIGTNCDTFLKQGVSLFRALEFENNSPWKRYMDTIGNKLNSRFATPPEEEPFYEFNNATKKYELTKRKAPALPTIRYGRISSGNYVQDDPEKRDMLYKNENVMAIEVKDMHVHDSKDYQNINYLVICGISDFCDHAVETEYHQYAAATAAAYTFGLLGSMRNY